MKKIVSLIIAITFLGCQTSDKQIINEVIKNLNSLETIEYNLVRHNVSKKFSVNKIDSSLCFFNFKSDDTLIGAKYQFIAKHNKNIFNGIEKFTVNENQKRVLLKKKPSRRDLAGNETRFSIFELKKVLPHLIDNPNVQINRLKDTIVDNKDCYKLQISLKESWIGVWGSLQKTEGHSSEYFITISKKKHLPIQFGYIHSGNNGYSISTYNNIDLSIKHNHQVLSLSKFNDEYLIFENDYFLNHLKVENEEKTKLGQAALDWKLPSINGDSISLSKSNNNLILIEFWFPGCVPCVEAIPELNKIYDKYSTKGLLMYSIEYTKQNKNTISSYISKHKINFPILYGGKKVAENYGVWSAPSFFLIDEKGKIIYKSVGLKKEELIVSINKYLD